MSSGHPRVARNGYLIEFIGATSLAAPGTDADGRAFAALRRSELIGRPVGDDAFLDEFSHRLNRVVTPCKRGRKPKGDVAGRGIR